MVYNILYFQLHFFLLLLLFNISDIDQDIKDYDPMMFELYDQQMRG